MKSKYIKQTRAMYERYLNDYYYMECSFDQAFTDLEHLTVRERIGGYVTDQTIRKCIANRTAGSLLRRLDPIAFQCGYQDWCKS